MAALFLLTLPGALLAYLLFRAEADALSLGFLALCGGIAHQVLLLLALHALPGPLSWWLVLLAFDALSLLLGWLAIRQPLAASMILPPAQLAIPLALTLLLAAGLRLLFLGGAEVQGDEARALLLAADAVNGRDTILLWHSKGPVEVLLPMGPLALVGATNEWVARLPFALAAVGVPLGAYLLARRMFERWLGPTMAGLAGLVAAAILALDGYLIAFARIIQYQSVLVLVTLGALWCCWRFYEGAPQPRLYLICAAALAAVALLAHYDGIFALPTLGWLVLAGGWRRGWRGRRWPAELALPLLVGAALVASFYVPFVLNEQWEHTLEYLRKRTGESGPRTFNNLPGYYRLATFYNTTFQIGWLGLSLAAGFVAWVGRYVRPRPLGWGLATLLALGGVILARDPQRFALENGSWAIVAFGLPIAGLVLAPATPAPLRALVLWFGAAFLAEAFLIANPMTHFYTMDAAAALLIGLAVALLAARLHGRPAWLKAPLALAGAALLLLATPYLYIVFVRQTPEYRHVFPAARPAIYQAIYGEQLPAKDGYFGFPHRAGWKVIGQLYDQGVLHGNFDSNEDYLITHWYSRKSSRCDQRPDYYFLARTPLDPVKVPIDMIKQDYHVFGSVLVGGAPTIDIYSRQPVAQPQQFAFEQYISAFDQKPLASPIDQRVVLDLAPADLAGARWGRGISLESYSIRRLQLVAAQESTLVFRWRATEPLDRTYDVTLDVTNSSGQRVASVNPLCASAPVQDWHSHEINSTSFFLIADPSLPPDAYTLELSLRDPQNGALLPLADGTATLTVATLDVTAR
jgi:hypothetical protein